MLETVHIISEIDLKEANVSLRSDGLVYVFFKENCVLDIELQLRLYESYHKITDSKLNPFLFLADNGVTVTKEARDNAIVLEERSPCAVTAVVVTNLAYKLIANFYMQFNKPKRPYKVFNNKSEAIEWLKTFL
ncbi:MAG: hypothetical protein V4677_17110 [Bacteroidota bacterium]